MQATGANATLKFVPESTWGTKPTVNPGDSIAIPFANEGLDCSQARETNPNIKSTRNYGPGVLGAVDCGGEVSFRLNGTAHGQILKALLGSCTTTGNAAPYTHVFKVGTTLPSYTVEKGLNDVSEFFLLNGLRCGSASFRFAATGFVEVSTNWMGKGEDATSPAASTMDGNAVSHTDAVFAMTAAAMTIEEGGSPIATVTALEFTVDNELDGGAYALAGQGYRAAVTPGMAKVTGSLTAIFEDSTLYSKAVAGTETSIVVTLSNGNGNGTAGNERLEIHLDEVLYGRSMPKVGGAAGLVVELPFEAALSDDSDASSVWFELQNGVAVYP